MREQYWGKAEGQPFGETSGFVRKPGRYFKFEDGESLEDVRARANEVYVVSMSSLVHEGEA